MDAVYTFGYFVGLKGIFVLIKKDHCRRRTLVRKVGHFKFIKILFPLKLQSSSPHLKHGFIRAKLFYTKHHVVLLSVPLFHLRVF
jgi:hypothetical protein